SLVAEDGEARIRVTLPTETDAGALVDRLGERYAGTQFRSYRERTRPAKTKTEYLASVRDRLTDRQYAALRKAYIGGYFERPRPVTGDDLAASMGVTRATFHQHLVAAQRKLLDEFFADAE
ncbi:helix-turn-helix domain-containing protein, partial [Halobium palmae]